MMRYLEYDFLRDHGLQHFDNWVAVFGDQKTDWELKPAGNGFKERTRMQIRLFAYENQKKHEKRKNANLYKYFLKHLISRRQKRPD